jgi:hypothetical protein
MTERFKVLLNKSIIQNAYEELASAIVPYSGYQFSVGENKGTSEGTMESLTDTDSIFSAINKTHSVSGNVGVKTGLLQAGVSYGFSSSDSNGKSSGTAATKGKNFNLMEGTTENATYNYQSFAVKGLLDKLQMQLKRINNGRSLGLWKCASYVLAGSPRIAINVANFIKSLTQGDESYIEPPIINTWDKKDSLFFRIYWNTFAILPIQSFVMIRKTRLMTAIFLRWKRLPLPTTFLQLNFPTLWLSPENPFPACRCLNVQNLAGKLYRSKIIKAIFRLDVLIICTSRKRINR